MDYQGVAIEPNRQWLKFMKRLRFLGKHGKRNANDATGAVQIGAPTLELRPADPLVLDRRGRIVHHEYLASVRIPRCLLNLRQQGRGEVATHPLDDTATISIEAELEFNPKVSAHDAGSLRSASRPRPVTSIPALPAFVAPVVRRHPQPRPRGRWHHPRPAPPLVALNEWCDSLPDHNPCPFPPHPKKAHGPQPVGSCIAPARNPVVVRQSVTLSEDSHAPRRTPA